MPQNFVAAIFVVLLLALLVVLANVFVFLRVLPEGTGYTNHWHWAWESWSAQRPSRMATAAWVLSLAGAWLGPLIAITSPLAVVLGLWVKRRVACRGGNRATRIAANIAIINGAIFFSLAASLVLVWVLSSDF